MFRYCGEYFDSETGTIYLRARYYNPTTDRFISRDSYAGRRSDPLSLNLYTYCQNNPVRYIDPSGHIIIEHIVGAVILGCAFALTSCDNKTVGKVQETSTPNPDYTGTTTQVATSTRTTAQTTRTTTTTTTATVESKKSPSGISPKGVEYLKQYESFEPKAYLLRNEKYYTIGYGHQIHEGGTSVEINGVYYDELTEELASTLFTNDINKVFAPTLNNFLSENDISLTQNQYDALIADSFQKGQNIWLDDSYSITAYIKAEDFSDYDTCLKAFIGDPGNDEYRQGRINRRTSEANYFFYGE